MKTKRSWLVWFAPLIAAVPLALTNCGGSTTNPGIAGSGIDAGGASGSVNGSGSNTSGTTPTSGTTMGTGAGAGSTAGSGMTATSGTTAQAGAGTGATTGATGGTGATTGAGGTGATTGATGGTGASAGATSGATDPCTDGMYVCRMGQQCSETLGCVQCLTNANCPPAGGIGGGNANLKVCVLGSCEACGADTDCAAGQVCEPATHTCRASCIADGGANCANRGGAPICDMTTGACVGCVTAKDCTN